jgi:uncharacterized protein (TIGR00369 family)
VDGPDADTRAALLAAFTNTPLHAFLGFEFRETPAPDGTVVVEMPVAPPAFNGSGNLHGGAIATLVDVAAGSDLHVRYLGRPKAGPVRAEAHVVRSGHMLIVVEVRVLDPLDDLIASADFSAMVVARREPLAGATPTDPQTPDL